MTLRALEFYSGIGGMNYSLILSGVDCVVVQAFDINTNANKVYSHNFHHRPNPKTIESLTKEEIEAYKADLFLMSPPCQPFTRQGLQRGNNDPRTKSFLHLLSLIPHLLPRFILIENVVGFEKSDTHETLKNVLDNSGYIFTQFHLSPTQFGIPNQRLRYFCVARLSPRGIGIERPIEKNSEQILNFIPSNPHFNPESSSSQSDQSSSSSKPKEKSNKIQDYLMEGIDDNYMIPDDVLLLGSGMLFDIVFPESTHSCCFTKSYGKYIEGTGSVIQLASPSLKADLSNPSTLIPLKLRYFSPLEIAYLHGFPREFQYSPEMSRIQCYRLIGNSLSVFVVSELIKFMFEKV